MSHVMCHVSCVMCQESCVMCHVSGAMCPVSGSPVRCQVSHFFYKVMELVGGGPVINMAAKVQFTKLVNF